MDELDALTGVIEALEQLGIPYRIGGSAASSVHGLPRSTTDIDLVAAVRREHVDILCALLRPRYYAEPELLRLAVDTGTCCNFIHLPSAYKIDVFVRRDGPFDLQEFEHCCRRTLDAAPGAREFEFATAEDVILRKLLWYRAGGETSERQWLDVRGILRVQQGRLDPDYLRRWAQQLGVEDLLQRALAEAGSG